MDTRKKIKLFVFSITALILLFALGALLLNTVVQGYYGDAERASSFKGIDNTYGYTRTFANERQNIEFLSHGSVNAKFAVWGRALFGTFSLSISDANGKLLRAWQGQGIDDHGEIELPRGMYSIALSFENYAGSLRFGLDSVVFAPKLNGDRYRVIAADASQGFSWDYLLYTPKELKASRLLVVPNNTGYVDNDIAFHRVEAQSLIQEMSALADELGTPLLVPIFPRPAGELEGYYTHNLDRNVLLMDREGYRRLDLQLLAMVDDARSRLESEDVEVDARFLLWGFSASGTFADRFSLLHPDRLVAVASAGSHSLPFATFEGEKLPYPIGTFDYKSITGAPFDMKAFAALPRFLYQGDEDHGGRVTTNEGSFLADEYFDRFERPLLEARAASAPKPLVKGLDMNSDEEALIKLRIYRGAAFVKEFIAIRDIYAKAGLNATKFALYPGVGHEITEEMERDVRDFFLAYIK